MTLSRFAIVAVAASFAAAQDPAPAEVEVLRAQLASDRLGEVAWAAYRIGEHRCRDLTPELRQLLYGIARDQESRGTQEERDALMLALFDTMIQSGAALPARELAPWLSPGGGCEGILLAAHNPAEHAGALLALVEREQWWDAHWVAACNLMIDAAPALLAPCLLDRVQVELTVAVVSPGQLASVGFRCGSGCGDGAGRRLDGFPPVVRYDLRLDRGAGDAIAPGPTPVWAQRVEHEAASFGFGSCVRRVDRVDYALRCLFCMAERDAEGQHLRTQVRESVEWRGVEALGAEIARSARQLQAEYSELLGALAARRLVSQGVAESTRLRLQLRVDDQRREGDRGEALPAAELLLPR